MEYIIEPRAMLIRGLNISLPAECLAAAERASLKRRPTINVQVDMFRSSAILKSDHDMLKLT